MLLGGSLLVILIGNFSLSSVDSVVSSSLTLRDPFYPFSREEKTKAGGQASKQGARSSEA